MPAPPPTPDDPRGSLEDQIMAAADRLERLEEDLRAEPPSAGPAPAEFRSSSTRLLHELQMLRSDIIRMREEAAQLRAATVPRTEYDLRRRQLMTAGALLFLVLALSLGMFLFFQERSNDEAADFRARTRQFQQEAIAACQIRNSRIRNEQAFAENVLKVLATAAGDASNQVRNPQIQSQYAAALASYRRGLGTIVDCTKQARALGNG
jgi:hypothetical protein